jgi:hypothetical protein
MARLPSLRRSRFSTLALAAVVIAVASAARANGAFPDEFSVHFPANASNRMLIGANFGLLVSDDAGATWRYACEPWVTVGSSDPLSPALVSFYQVTVDGAVLADWGGITRSTDACNWPTSTGSVAAQGVQDIFADPNNKDLVLAILARTDGSSIVASHDGGKTFDSTPILDRPNEVLTGIEIARSKAGVFYATSIPISGGSAKFFATTDSGAHWAPPTELQVPSGTQVRILGIDPVNEKNVYVRELNGPSDAIAVTTDSGQTFNTLLTIRGAFTSFLRAGDGAVYAGTMEGSLYVMPKGASAFNAPQAGPHLRCLGQRPGTSRIYACGDMVLDGFSLGYSDDNGATFHPVMSFKQLLGPLTCAPVQTACQAHWDRIQGVLGIGMATDAGQGSAGGGGGGGGSGGGGGGSCASAGADLLCIAAVATLLLRRIRT